MKFTRILICLLGLCCFHGFVKGQTGKINNNAGPKNKNTVSIADYSVVFSQDKVNRIDIVIDPQDWANVLKDMENHFGKFAQGFMHPPRFKRDSIGGETIELLPHHPDSAFGEGPGFMPPRFRPDSAMGEGFMPPPMFGDSMHRPQFPGQGKMPPMSQYSPDYIRCSLQFEGKQWEAVGFRLKGNSSLMSSWSRGIKKFPFRLDFKKFKQQEAEIQTFFGFQEFSFSSNNDDQTLLREKITADIFRESGVKAPHTAFYRVFIDYGEGPQYFGLYTVVEIVEDTMLKNQFGDNSGNCYKPEGEAASFSGVFDNASFEKKTNKKKADWSDVQNLFAVINSPARSSDPEKWKAELEAIFNVPVFMNWLAVNNVIRNWDTYGQMSHNFYLYNNPATHKLTWIPWDNNEALMRGKGRPLTLSLNEVTNKWPLIRYLMDQPEYAAIYKESIKIMVNNTWDPIKINGTIDFYANLIKPYVIGKSGEVKNYTFLNSPDEFNRAIAELKKHIEKQTQAAKTYIEK